MNIHQKKVLTRINDEIGELQQRLVHISMNYTEQESYWLEEASMRLIEASSILFKMCMGYNLDHGESSTKIIQNGDGCIIIDRLDGNIHVE